MGEAMGSGERSREMLLGEYYMENNNEKENEDAEEKRVLAEGGYYHI